MTFITNEAAAKLNKELGDNNITIKKKAPWYLSLLREMTTVFALLLWAGSVLCFIAYGLFPTDESNV